MRGFTGAQSGDQRMKWMRCPASIHSNEAQNEQIRNSTSNNLMNRKCAATMTGEREAPAAAHKPTVQNVQEGSCFRRNT